jgi:hypothetical protein
VAFVAQRSNLNRRMEGRFPTPAAKVSAAKPRSPSALSGPQPRMTPH